MAWDEANPTPLPFCRVPRFAVRQASASSHADSASSDSDDAGVAVGGDTAALSCWALHHDEGEGEGRNRKGGRFKSANSSTKPRLESNFNHTSAPPGARPGARLQATDHTLLKSTPTTARINRMFKQMRRAEV